MYIVKGKHSRSCRARRRKKMDFRCFRAVVGNNLEHVTQDLAADAVVDDAASSTVVS